MHAYRFRILSDEQDDFIRDVEILASQSFLDFHSYLVRLLEFDSNELASFSICNTKWYKLCEITLLDMEVDDDQPPDDEEVKKPERLKTYLMADSKLRDFMEDPHQRLIYEYDFLEMRTFFLELTKILPAEMGIQYPRCLHSEGSLVKRTLKAGDMVLHQGSDIDELDLEEGEKEYEDELDDNFLKNITDGYEIEMDQSIGMNIEEPFEGNFGESSKN